VKDLQIDKEIDRPEEPGSRIPRNPDKPVQRYRLIIQVAFALLCVWIGVEFHFFVRFLESGGTAAFVERPPGVDGFLPISSLMSLYYFFLSDVIHPAHPAGLFILVAALVVSLVFGKAFCSWLCPVGFISEMLGDIADKIFRRKLRLPKFLDYPLRSLKYLLLVFFVYSIFFAMTEMALRAFLDSPYNLVSDIKMYYFFADISRLVLYVILALFLLSVVIRGFWCRYLCPYGALLGFFTLLSPNKIRRNQKNCIDCGQCTNVCPSNIKIDQISTVVSDECTTCMACVDNCPVANTLELRLPAGRGKIPSRLVAAGVVLLFVAVTAFGMLTGNWQNNLTGEEYLHHHKHLMSYGHPTGTNEISELNKSAAKSVDGIEGSARATD
jgi:polyferredoxin